MRQKSSNNDIYEQEWKPHRRDPEKRDKRRVNPLIESNMKIFIIAIGLFLIIEGLPYFAFPDKVKTLLLKVRDISDETLRILGLAAMLTGLMLVYLGRN
jgi:uncharacterized protein YjeT (DUF2065 family)